MTRAATWPSSPWELLLGLNRDGSSSRTFPVSCQAPKDETSGFSCEQWMRSGILSAGQCWRAILRVAQRRERVFAVGYIGDWRGPAAVKLIQSVCAVSSAAPGNGGKACPDNCAGHWRRLRTPLQTRRYQHSDRRHPNGQHGAPQRPAQRRQSGGLFGRNDHMTPICRGGADDRKNVVSACQRCNARKAMKTFEEFRMFFALENGWLPARFYGEHPPFLRDVIPVISPSFLKSMAAHNGYRRA